MDPRQYRLYLRRVAHQVRASANVRSERGILVAAFAVVAILSASLLLRPAPTGRSSPSEPGEQAISARFATTTEALPGPVVVNDGGASSKDADPVESLVSAAPYPGAVHEVANPEQWSAATAAAKPGDIIRLVANINQPLRYWGSRNQSQKQTGTDGTAERPITITAAPGVWIDPGNQSNRVAALDIGHTAHVNIVGVRVRNSQFGIRLQDSIGTSESPIIIANSEVTDIGHAGIHVAGRLSTHEPSRFVQVRGNVVTRTGRIAGQFGEGIYIGYGSVQWVDNTTGVEVLNNDISFTTAEGIDIKPGTRNVLVEGNLIHDLAPISGGAISAHYVGNTPNPDPSTPGNVIIRKNRIWNMNLEAAAGANDWAIWVGHGGVTIENNAIWGLRGNPNQTRAVRIRALQDFGPHPIQIKDNIFWTSTGWLAEGSPSGAGQIQASGNRGPSGAKGIEAGLDPNNSVPALGAGGTADNGSGPGSALGFQPVQPLRGLETEPGFAG